MDKFKNTMVFAVSGIMRRVILAILLCLLSTPAVALVYIESDGVLIYYPAEQHPIAAGMQRKLPGMLEFLSEHGLEIKRPLHVIIDEELDFPAVNVYTHPHRGIRIPLRAPGVMEEGSTEADPWSYFLFSGLALHGIYGLRGGIPEAGYRIFGEIIKTNDIMPPWVNDGIINLLFKLYSGRNVRSPIEEAIFKSCVAPSFDLINNHPQTWPGQFSHRIYGRPFVSWLYENYGWSSLLEFLEAHGRGVVPIEVDLKANRIFGKTFSRLWDDFIAQQNLPQVREDGILALGYVPDPKIYWNYTDIVPGTENGRLRGRYGYVDKTGTARTLWLSEYIGRSYVVGYRGQHTVSLNLPHLWDPGQGGVAVHLLDGRPHIAILPADASFFDSEKKLKEQVELIAAPPGIIQLSGPVRRSDGTVAVAGNSGGNWDIWIHNQAWQRITDSPSMELDPCWEGGSLSFASNISGSFQIHDADFNQLSQAPLAALMPRTGHYLSLKSAGWHMEHYAADLPSISRSLSHLAPPVEDPPLDARPHSPFKSLLPNYWWPDVYLGSLDFQIGMSTRSKDISQDYRTDFAFRYLSDLKYTTFRLGGKAKDFGLQLTQYPLAYNPRLQPTIEESRYEVQLNWEPDLDEVADLQVGLTRMTYGMLPYKYSLDKANYILNHFNTDYYPRSHEDFSDVWNRNFEYWTTLSLAKSYGDLSTWGTTEIYPGGRKSLYGGLAFRAGKEIYSIMHLQAGRTWGDTKQGHGTFRIGGDVGEGYFTRRPSHLFPIRGFSSNLLEADQAISTGIEVYWPLANINRGYKTMPLFLHRMRLGTFVDVGACRNSISWDDTLVGAGFELITSMEVAWGSMSNFRIGVAWPIRHPDYYPDWHPYNWDDLDENDPKVILQLGLPL